MICYPLATASNVAPRPHRAGTVASGEAETGFGGRGAANAVRGSRRGGTGLPPLLAILMDDRRWDLVNLESGPLSWANKITCFL